MRLLTVSILASALAFVLCASVAGAAERLDRLMKAVQRSRPKVRTQRRWM